MLRQGLFLPGFPAVSLASQSNCLDWGALGSDEIIGECINQLIGSKHIVILIPDSHVNIHSLQLK